MDSFLPLKHIPVCVWDFQYSYNKCNLHFSFKLVLVSIWYIEHEWLQKQTHPSYKLQYPVQPFPLNYIIIKGHRAQLIPVYLFSFPSLLSFPLFVQLFFFVCFPFWIHASYWCCWMIRTGFVSPDLLLTFCLLRFLPYGNSGNRLHETGQVDAALLLISTSWVGREWERRSRLV